MNNQIEEMAVIGCARTPQAHTTEECTKCGFKNGRCNAYRHAEALYNAGYRKISEDSVVLSREEYERLNECYKVRAFNKLRAENKQLKDRIAELEKEIEENAFYSKGYADGIKNTYEVVIPEKLKKFAKMLKKKYGKSCSEYYPMLIEMTSDDIDETLKEFIND